jgi:hypothetical protein
MVQVAGIGVQVENEVLGTGDSANKSFDTAEPNVIATSYTLNYGSASTEVDTNSLTALTETTHYTLTKDSGVVLLTTAGVTALGTNVLYISYTHSPKASDTILNNYLAAAEKEVDKMTSNTWGTSTDDSEFFDWEDEMQYPTTDEPYIRDYDPPEELQLKYRGIISLTGAFVVAPGTAIGNAQSYDLSGTSYTDVTTSINTSGGAGINPFAATTAANDYLYIGNSQKFLGLHTLLFTNGVTAGTNTIEYYDGSSWVAISATESATGVLNFEASGKLSWSSLQDWSKTTVNGSSSLYFVRVVANSTYSTEALLNFIYMDQDSIIERDIPLSQVQFSSEGRVIFHTTLPNGKRNIRIDYSHGYSTTPADAQELTDLVIALRVFAAITGGSYDDATVFSLGRKSVSIGEVYVNVREATKQFQTRINQLLPGIGQTLHAC